jgi:hypothetical protein
MKTLAINGGPKTKTAPFGTGKRFGLVLLIGYTFLNQALVCRMRKEITR